MDQPDQDNVLLGLILTIYAAQLDNTWLNGFGSIMHALKSGDSGEALGHWAATDQSAARLHDIQQAYFSDPLIQKSVNKLEIDDPIVKKEFSDAATKKKTRILGMCLNNADLPDINHQKWLDLLRIWLIIHAAKRFRKGVYADKNIMKVAQFISAAMDRYSINKNVASIFWDFGPHDYLEPLELFDRRLHNRIEMSGQKKMSSYDRSILNALNDIASRKSDPGDQASSINTRDRVSLLDPLFEQEPPVDPSVYYPDLDHEDWLPGITLFPDIEPDSLNDDYENEDDGLYVTRVDPDESPGYQRLSLNSEWRWQVELLHFLPHSWSKLTKQEWPPMMDWIMESLDSSDQTKQFLGVCNWLAVATCRTPRRVLDFLINETHGGEWTIHPKTFVLGRIPPSRRNSWSPSSPDQASWVQDYTAHNTLLPIKQIQAILKKITKQVPEAQTLVDCWNALLPGISIEALFTENKPDELERITAGMLGNTQPQTLFEYSNDPLFARMIAAHPQSGLSGAFSYYNWGQEYADPGSYLNQQDEIAPYLFEGQIGFGSRLDPIERLIIDEISQTHQRITKIDKYQEPIVFHNNISSYLMLALWAGTGCRPVHDAFESYHHFNRDYAFAYINDKSDDTLRQGRDCPVPTWLIHIVFTTYLRHLSILSEGLDPVNPELANEIKLMSQGLPSGRLPFFFMLDETNLNWKSVSATLIDETEVFQCPLPPNLFRQRLIKQLRRVGIEQEVIGAWMGHNEIGNTPYCDFSIRNWIGDLDHYRESFDGAFDRLGFKGFHTWETTPTITISTKSSFKKGIFGIAKRKKQRQKNHQHAAEQANRDIDEFLGTKDLASLSDEDIDKLTLSLITFHDGKPRPYAHVRYEQLSNRLEDLWNSTGKKSRPSWVALRFTEDSHGIKADSPKFYTLLEPLRQRWQEIVNSTPASKIGKSDSRLFLIIGLILENRITYSGMLKDIYQGDNVRLIRYRRRYYLEYSESLGNNNMYPYAAVQRHRLEPHTAHFLNNILTGRHKPDADNFHKSLDELRAYLSTQLHTKIRHHQGLIDRLRKVMDQCNRIDLPGSVAGFLGGRVLSCALNWVDWVRLDSNRVLVIDMLPEDKEDDSTNRLAQSLSSSSTSFHIEPSDKIEQETLQENARTLIQEIRSLLYQYDRGKRRETVAAIHKICDRSCHQVSPAILALGEWIAQVVKEGNKLNQKDYAADTPKRYFDELAPAFIEEAYTSNPYLMDRNELTEFYQRLLAYTEMRSKEKDYFEDRLIEFHDFIHKQDVVDPIWAGLNLSRKKRRVSAGILTVRDYHSAFKLLLHEARQEPDADYRKPLALLLYAHFGLRPKETLGLRTNDLALKEDDKYLIVRPYKTRGLKRPASRRLVPLIRDLTDEEQQIISQSLEFVHIRYPGIDNPCLFARGDSPYKADDGESIIRHINQVLKAVTGNSKMVIYMARHGFANQVDPILYHLDIPLWNKLTKNDFDHQEVRRIALGAHNRVARRNTMAAARLKGHGHERTQAVNYQHFYGDWSDLLTHVGNKPTDKRLKRAIVIDDMEMKPLPRIKDLSSTRNYIIPTPTTFLNFLIMAWRGKSFADAGELLSIAPDQVESFLRLIALADDQQQPVNSNNEDHSDSRMQLPEFILRIKASGWKRLLDHMRNISANIEPTRSEEFSAEDFIGLIGQTRQLAMYDEHHFSQVSEFLKALSIDPNIYLIYQKNRSDDILSLASKYQMDVMNNDDLENLGKNIRLDPVRNMDKEWKRDINTHCALIFNKNSTTNIRNSYEFIALFICYIAAAEFSPNKDTDS